MTQIILTHANTKREVVVTRELVFAIYHSAAHQATHILSNAGGIIPVAESVDKVRVLVYGSSTHHKPDSNGSDVTGPQQAQLEKSNE